MGIYIGVVGRIAAGKEVFAEYLIKKHGFTTFSLSTVIHHELERRGIKNFTRKTLQDVGDELRKKFGDDILARRTIEILNAKHKLPNKLQILNKQKSENLEFRNSNLFGASNLGFRICTKGVIITGIRNPAEVKFFRTLPNFILVAVEAQRKIRFKRVLRRGKPWDPRSWKEFLKVDRRDLGFVGDKSGQQVGECLKMADCTIINNKDMGSFYEKIEKFMTKLKVKN